MSYTDVLFDPLESVFDAGSSYDIDVTPKATHDQKSRLRQVSSIAALPSYDPHSPFNSPNMYTRAKGKAPAAFLTSPVIGKGTLGSMVTPRQHIRIVDDYAGQRGAAFEANPYLNDEAIFDQTTTGLGMGLSGSSAMPPVNFADMRVYGVPMDKSTGRQATHGHFLPYLNNLPGTVAAAHDRKENTAPSRQLDQQPASPRMNAQALSQRNMPGSPPAQGLAPVSRGATAPKRRTKRTTTTLSIKTDIPIVEAATPQPNSPKRVKSMPAMRAEPRTPSAAMRHAPMPTAQPQVPFNSPSVYATPARQQAQMPFSFSELFDMGLAEGSNLDLGAYGGPRSPSAFSYGMESGLSSATASSLDFGLGMSSEESSLLPTPLLQPSSVLSTPSSVGCRSPDGVMLNPMDSLINPMLAFGVDTQPLSSPTGSQYSDYDELLSPQSMAGHALVPSMHEELNWTMPATATSVPMSRGFQSIDSVLSAGNLMPPQSPAPRRRAQRAISRKRSRADFVAEHTDEDEDEYASNGGRGGDDEEFVLSSEDIEVAEQESDDGDYNPGGYFSPPLPRRQFSAQEMPTFSFNEPPTMQTRVFSAPGGRLRPGPKPKRSMPNLNILTVAPTGPDLQVVRDALLRVGADPDLVFQTEDLEEEEDGGEPYQGSLNRAVIRALYQGVGTSGQRRYKCLIEGCERLFPRKSAIESHIQTHLEDKPFVCAIDDCGAAFVRPHDLRRHQRIHSGIKTHNCPCGKGFARGDALQRHRQRGICIGSTVPRRA